VLTHGTVTPRQLYVMRLLPAILRASVLAALLVSASAVDAQLFRRSYSSRGYYEMGCDCRYCVASRGGTYASVYGRVTKSKAVVVPAKKPSAPSPPQVILLALEIADVKPHDSFLDIGSGDGRVIEVAVRDFGCKAVGIEVDAALAKQSATRLRGIMPYDSSWNIVTGDATAYNLSKATVAYMYLYPEMVAKVTPLLTGCTRIISFKHPVPGYTNVEYATEWGPLFIVDADGVAAKCCDTIVEKTLVATETAPAKVMRVQQPRPVTTACRT